MNSHGVDISTFQGSPDLDLLSGKADFVIMRHSIGALKDKQFDRNWLGCKDKTLRGIYYVPHPNVSLESAKAKLREIFTYKPDLPIVLDVEIAGVYIDLVYGLAGYIYSKTGKYPMIYTSPGFWGSLWGKANGTHKKFFENCPLWVANYKVAEPNPVAPWGSNWTFWQYRINSNIDDVKAYGLRYWESKAIDENWFHGTYAELLKWTGSEIPAPSGKDVAVEITCPFYWLRSEPRYVEETKDIILPEGYIAKLTGAEKYEEESGITWLEVKLNRMDYTGWLSKNLNYIRMISE